MEGNKMKIDAKEGDKITIMRKKANNRSVEPHPILVRVEKVGLKYITGVCNWFDSQEKKVVENNRYSSRFNMEEYDIISKCFDVGLIKRFRDYEQELRGFTERKLIALREIEWEEKQKYYDAKAKREAEWRENNPQPKYPDGTEVKK